MSYCQKAKAKDQAFLHDMKVNGIRMYWFLTHLGGRIGGHYFLAWCLLRPENKKHTKSRNKTRNKTTWGQVGH